MIKSEKALRLKWVIYCRDLQEARAAGHLSVAPIPEDLKNLRCNAKTRAGTPCQMKVLHASGRCKLHGGLSTGPRTEAGKEKARQNGKLGGRGRRAKPNPMNSSSEHVGYTEPSRPLVAELQPALKPNPMDQLKMSRFRQGLGAENQHLSAHQIGETRLRLAAERCAPPALPIAAQMAPNSSMLKPNPMNPSKLVRFRRGLGAQSRQHSSDEHGEGVSQVAVQGDVPAAPKLSAHDPTSFELQWRPVVSKSDYRELTVAERQARWHAFCAERGIQFPMTAKVPSTESAKQAGGGPVPRSEARRRSAI
ncbi:MAG: HGGxSTG domain-containing protein [Hydrogenophaga sp.]|uniref:HGGxSTG domain-containing protein n=1 Tax=Hydrogenophaga sp. TaxID=1904254 RepID=UPI0040356E01